MKPEAGVLGENELRVKVAELCGWTEVGAMEYGFHPGTSNATHVKARIPDYTKDLNAMHEAEKLLSEADRMTYSNELVKICNAENTWLMLATARQRAEAFVKTMEDKSVL